MSPMMIPRLMSLLGGSSPKTDLPHPNPGIPTDNSGMNSALINALSGSPGIENLIPSIPRKKERSKIGNLVIAHFSRQLYRPSMQGNQTISQPSPQAAPILSSIPRPGGGY